MDSRPASRDRIDDPALARLVERFYGQIRQDGELGPIFNAAVDDWPAHFAKLTDFWSSVMLASGRYKGNPVAAHLRHTGRITPALFDRWLSLWAMVTEDVMAPAAAAALQAKAARIAESLQLAMFFKLPSAQDRKAA